MPDLLVHLILDGLPEGSPGSGVANGAAMWRIVSAPALGSRYNKPFLFKRPANLDMDLKNVIDEVNRAVLSSNDSDRLYSSKACRILQLHGASLFNELNDSSKNLMEALVQQAEFNRRHLLLLIQFGDGARDLASCQWEALFDKARNKFLLLGGTVARYIPAGRSPPAPSQKLRVLVASSNYGTDGVIDPQLGQYAKADLDGLQRSLEGLRDKGIVDQVIVLQNPSQHELHGALRDNIDLLHFFGHGGVDPVQGEYLVLRGPRKHDPGICAYFDQLQHVFQPADTPHLRLVVINACQLEEQARLGARLVGDFGIPGVITMKARIGTEVIADRHGFTETFYRHIAEGKAVHEAYHLALTSIWFASTVETFVPTLTLGIAEPLILIDPTQPAPQKIRIENQQRRLPIEEAIQMIQQALSRLDHDGLAAGLKKARPYAHDLQISEVIGNVFENVKVEMERLQRARQWPQALQCGNTLQAVAELLSADRQQESKSLTQNLRWALDIELEALRNTIGKLRSQQGWPDVVSNAEQYLQLKSDDGEIRGWLEEAREFVSIAQSIVTVDETTQVGSAFSQLENLVRAGDLKAAEALFMGLRQQLAPHQATAFRHQILLGKANLARQRGDWQAARHAAEDLRQMEPGNTETAEILSDVLLEEAAGFLRAGNHGEAESRSKEAADLAQSPRVIQFREHLYVDWIQKSQAKADWKAVLRVSQRALADPQLAAIHIAAKDKQREAHGYLDLWDQIRVVN